MFVDVVFIMKFMYSWTLLPWASANERSWRAKLLVVLKVITSNDSSTFLLIEIPVDPVLVWSKKFSTLRLSNRKNLLRMCAPESQRYRFRTQCYLHSRSQGRQGSGYPFTGLFETGPARPGRKGKTFAWHWYPCRVRWSLYAVKSYFSIDKPSYI